MSQDQPFIWKSHCQQVEWAHKWGETESQGISWEGQKVLGRLMESQIWHQPAGSVALWEEGSIKGQWPQPTFLSERKLSPSSCLNARHFSSSPYAIGAFQTATPGWSSEGALSKSVCRFFERNNLRLWKFLPLTQSPPVFAARSYGDLSFWHWNPGLGVLMWGWNSLLPRYPPRIFIHHTWM